MLRHAMHLANGQSCTLCASFSETSSPSVFRAKGQRQRSDSRSRPFRPFGGFVAVAAILFGLTFGVRFTLGLLQRIAERV